MQYSLRTTHRPSFKAQQSPPPQPATDQALHPDDANSKVFHAIRRAFLAVDNRAMTVKDLTDLAIANGLVCLNASAASQAITSYLRSHIQRCEVEQDQPLLLKHTLSGSTADDILLPALYSRSGGSRLEAGPSRSTNFRRGTTVWYLSRATGAPCPFARAGIRLSQHTQSAGYKRKRRGISSDRDFHSEEDDSTSDSENEAPPPKQRLTLKLPTLAQLKLRQTTISESCLPPYPPYSPDIPYTPTDPSVDYPRRSPSVPYSIRSGASPPPESDEEPADSSDIEMDEEDDISVQMNYHEEGEDYDDDDDDDDDGDFSSSEFDPDEGESPGPRSPSASPLRTVLVKEEPTDVQGILDHWEDSDLHTAKFGTFDVPNPIIKEDDAFPDFLDWDKAWSSSPSASASPPIKQEEEPLSLSFTGPSFTTWRQPDISSPVSPTGLILDETAHDYPPMAHSAESTLPQSLTTLIHELSVSSLPVACVSPSDTRIKKGEHSDVVIVKTCEPCEPEIFATQVEGISVYQTSLGPHTLLRRIDTDFVNLSPILIYAQSPHPVLTTIPGATVITEGSLLVQGVWVPLPAARAYVRDHPLKHPRDAAAVDLFFSDMLVERFPSALRQFVLSERQGNLTGQFGKSFGEPERAASPAAIALSATSLTSRVRDDASDIHHQHVHQLSALAPLTLSPSLPPPPLSATEERIFDELCVNLEWENDKPDLEYPATYSPPSSPLSSCPPSPELPPVPLPSHTCTESIETDKPLRRSKRVADKAARIRTRSMRA
ncbi:hypothetical protein D9758_003195 [Tetrapyrgos nigripes]|uniref:GDS1 winged helix domain-containing protein n=1 Tax=Tetrapyrgos nigripes TaxID=182062 RepID=A0A8H5GJ01_9AGAR|nr:hypothetical protein D9758_003195 [Tetrapyrgos nigripes]